MAALPPQPKNSNQTPVSRGGVSIFGGFMTKEKVLAVTRAGFLLIKMRSSPKERVSDDC
jgi:hypothetical protein